MGGGVFQSRMSKNTLSLTFPLLELCQANAGVFLRLLGVHEVFFQNFSLHEYIQNLYNLKKLETTTLADILSILKDFVRAIKYIFVILSHSRTLIRTFPYKNGAVRGRDLPQTRRGTLHGPSSTGVKHFLGSIPLRVIERYHQSSHDSCVVSSSFFPFLTSRDVGRGMTLERGLRAPAWVRLAPVFREEPSPTPPPPTDPPSREGGRRETKHFVGMA